MRRPQYIHPLNTMFHKDFKDASIYSNVTIVDMVTTHNSTKLGHIKPTQTLGLTKVTETNRSPRKKPSMLASVLMVSRVQDPAFHETRR